MQSLLCLTSGRQRPGRGWLLLSRNTNGDNATVADGKTLYKGCFDPGACESVERYVMKKHHLIIVLLFAFTVCTPAVYAQGGAKAGQDPSTIRDPDLEKDSLHNLEVARMYFKLRKAYVASLQRCEEIIAGNPNLRVSMKSYFTRAKVPALSLRTRVSRHRLYT